MIEWGAKRGFEIASVCYVRLCLLAKRKGDGCVLGTGVKEKRKEWLERRK